ncbi:MAG: nucleoside deaminase [Kiritimatiellae bacterium]|nr:nucleoside deaminase [Kiritimatiellia bacterium]
MTGDAIQWLKTGDVDERFMRMALRQAREAREAGEVPVGAVIVRGGAVIGLAHNQTERLKDPTAHAELIAVTQAAGSVGDWRLTETTLYVTKEPCPMCAGALMLARIPRVVLGARDPRQGGQSVFGILTHPGLNHRTELVTGVLEDECRELLRSFFAARRANT